MSSIKLIYAYWRERYPVSVFLPFSILIAAAGAVAGGSLPNARDALIGCVLAYTLILVFRIGDDGKLTFERKYDIDVGDKTMFWMGMVPL